MEEVFSLILKTKSILDNGIGAKNTAEVLRLTLMERSTRATGVMVK